MKSMLPIISLSFAVAALASGCVDSAPKKPESTWNASHPPLGTESNYLSSSLQDFSRPNANGEATIQNPNSIPSDDDLYEAARELWKAAYARSTYQGKPLDIKKGYPEPLWPDAIKALHPINVYLDDINTVIVLRIDSGKEFGIYIEMPESSHMPMPEQGFVMTNGVPGLPRANYERTRGNNHEKSESH